MTMEPDRARRSPTERIGLDDIMSASIHGKIHVF